MRGSYLSAGALVTAAFWLGGFTLPPVATTETVIESPAAKPLATGIASYYGARFAGRATASGEPFDPAALTAAHRKLPLGSIVRVTTAAGRSVVVRINDRGPYSGHRIIDVSRAAASRLGMLDKGVAKVSLELINEA